MGRNIRVAEEKRADPMLPIVGFVTLLVIGGLAFLASPYIITWLQTTSFSLAGFLKVLPIQFPSDWPPIANRLVVTFVVFIIFFCLGMMAIFTVMRPPGSERDVDLDEIRRAKKKRH